MINLKTTLSTLALAAAMAATSAIDAFAQSKPTVGIAMPTKSSARWIDDGNNIVKTLKERGYGTDLQYAEDDIPNQLSQIENMVTKGAKVLVIAAIDGTTLSDVLKQAKAKGIVVIAYDRLIRDTPNLDYYATFDNFQVGVLQAQSIEQALGLKDGKGPFNIELFGGSPDDNNAYLLLQRRDVGAAALYRQRQTGRRQRPDGHGQGLDVTLGRRHRPGADGQSAERVLRPQAGRRRAVAL